MRLVMIVLRLGVDCRPKESYPRWHSELRPQNVRGRPRWQVGHNVTTEAAKAASCQRARHRLNAIGRRCCNELYTVGVVLSRVRHSKGDG